VRRIDRVLAALDRGHSAGVLVAVDSLMMALPTEILADHGALRGREPCITPNTQWLKDNFPLEVQSSEKCMDGELARHSQDIGLTRPMRMMALWSPALSSEEAIV
jgi:hypothetical protein